MIAWSEGHFYLLRDPVDAPDGPFRIRVPWTF